MQSNNSTEWTYPPDDFDYKLVRDGAVALFRKQAVLEEATSWLSARQYIIHTMDAAGWKEDSDFHLDVARTLQFPHYYGQNFNALNDCLTDLEVPETGGMAVVLLHYDVFTRRDQEYAQAVVDVFARACWYFLVGGRRLLILVQSDDPFLQLGPLGCREAWWNPREWFNKDRV
jgi:RNAse (barnase) inhibitor barstar